jgi:protein subunit release factor A
MKIPKKDLKFEYMRGTGKGGQHKNKTSSCVRITHIPTGISAMHDGRHQSFNKRMAMQELQKRLKELKDKKKAKDKKNTRNYRIKNPNIIRTYDYKSGLVRDHRTGRVASLKDVMGKGRIDLLR